MSAPALRPCPRCGSANLWRDADGAWCLMCGEPQWAEPPRSLAEIQALGLPARLGRRWRCRRCGAELFTGETRRGDGGYVCKDGCAELRPALAPGEDDHGGDNVTPAPRSLPDVIDQMIAAMPADAAREVILGLRDLQQQAARFAAPEMTRHWWFETARLLSDELGDPSGAPWKMDVRRIFAGDV
ncbi:MAG TPA: hypothetical protein VII06_09730 [Chloroflexota bacterium]|jgi:hypothetical protein